MKKPEQLVPAAVFDRRDRADTAWEQLSAVDIPASVVTEPGTFGSTPHTTVFVERRHLERAQAILAPLVTQE